MLLGIKLVVEFKSPLVAFEQQIVLLPNILFWWEHLVNWQYLFNAYAAKLRSDANGPWT